jgi:hypothetical protein
MHLKNVLLQGEVGEREDETRNNRELGSDIILFDDTITRIYYWLYRSDHRWINNRFFPHHFSFFS